jgi:acyl-CoA thioesterase
LPAMADTDGVFPLRTYIGMDLDSPEPGHTLASVTIADEHLNPNGVVHGGVIFTMVDTAMGGACMGVLGDGEICASIEVQVRFLRAVSTGEIVADTTVLRQGRRVIQLESRVIDQQGILIATAAGSFAVITR